MNDTDYLNALLEQEKQKMLASSAFPPVAPTVIPAVEQPNTSYEARPAITREPSPEEKIKLMGMMLGETMQGAMHADSAYVNYGNAAGFAERDAARANLYKIAENLDKQRDALRRGQQKDLKPVTVPVIAEPVVPNFVDPQITARPPQPLPESIPYTATPREVYPQNQEKVNYQNHDSSQLEFDFKKATLDDVLDSLIKLINKVNDIESEIRDIKILIANKGKKKLK